MKHRAKTRSIVYGVMAIFCLAILMANGHTTQIRQEGRVATTQDSAKQELLVFVKPQTDPSKGKDVVEIRRELQHVTEAVTSVDGDLYQ
jgi:hypothetical protein